MQQPVVKAIMHLVHPLFFRRAPAGAHSVVFAAAHPAVREERDKYRGAFVEPDDVRGAVLAKPRAPQGESAELAEELWNGTEEVLKGMGL